MAAKPRPSSIDFNDLRRRTGRPVRLGIEQQFLCVEGGSQMPIDPTGRMKGAIFYSTKYGSTAEYAGWIGEATGLPRVRCERSPSIPPSTTSWCLEAR